MIFYIIPAMSFENRFEDLDFVARYVDGLLKSTGDSDYGVVYEWCDSGPPGWPPIAVLHREGGQWLRRRVLVSAKSGNVAWKKFGQFRLHLAEPEIVNGH